MFQTFYESPIQHPLLLLLAPLWLLSRLRIKDGFLSRSLIVFALLTILDPLATGPLSNWLGLSGAQTQAVTIFFVILGDFRWFYFFEIFQNRPFESQQILARPLLRALLLSLIVPVVQAITIRVFPDVFGSSRYVFLAYEFLFFVLAMSFLLFRVPQVSKSVRGFKQDLCRYAMLYYGLWALADIIIIAGVDAGFLLRVVPNQLYYSFFLPFVWWRSQRTAQAE